MQRHLCVDSTNTLRMEWFTAVNEATCIKLFNGQWAVGKSSATSIDLWAEVAAPLLLKKRGNHFLDKLPRLEPEFFFASEFALRMGAPVINDFFHYKKYFTLRSFTLRNVHVTRQCLVTYQTTKPNIRVLERRGTKPSFVDIPK
jgi:hypothetical protein